MLRVFSSDADQPFTSADYLSIKLHGPSVLFSLTSGDVGDWRNYFSAAQEEKFKLLFREKMKNSDLMKYYSKINSKM